MEKTIIIFGATGTIGVYLSDYLRSYNYNIIAVGKRKTDNGFFSELGIKYLSLDITKPEQFNNLPQENIFAVIHLASIMPARMEGYNPMTYFKVNTIGTLNILEYCRKALVDRIIYAQTRADSIQYMGLETLVPADIEKKFPLKGDHSVYAISKNAAVDLIENYFYEYGLKRFVLRLPTIYAYQPNPNYYVDGEKMIMAYRYMIDRALHNQSLEIWGDVSRKKEIVYVKDLTQIIANSLNVNIDGGVYNVGRGIGVTIEEQVLGIAKVFAKNINELEINYISSKPDTRQFVHDISKTQKELGYKSQYDYIKLLEDFKFEMNSNRFKTLWGE